MAGRGVHVLIHGASTAAAGVGAGLAQLPGSDAPVLAGIQAGMVLGIARHHGAGADRIAAADAVLTMAAKMTGRGVSQWLVGWFPLIGNVINAATAALITEAVGWAADAYFSDGGRADGR